MVDSITLGHAKAVVSHLSQLTEDKYSAIASETDPKKKAELRKTAIGPRMADLQPDQVILAGDGNNKITQQELVDTFNEQLTKNGGVALNQQQIAYLWGISIYVIKDPGGSAASTNSSSTVPAATIPSSSTTPSKTNSSTRTKPAEDTEAPTLISSSPSNAATDIAKNPNIDLTFSENIRFADSAKVKLFKKSDDTEVEITRSVEGGKTLRMKPQAALDDSTEYYVKIESGAI
ncbi:MAG: Ig-like domain-containing protein, partial [bacterium]